LLTTRVDIATVEVRDADGVAAMVKDISKGLLLLLVGLSDDVVV